jgi:hypothetical protein
VLLANARKGWYFVHLKTPSPMENQTQVPESNLVNYAAALHAENKTSWEVKEALKEKGLSEEQAERIAEESRSLFTDAVIQKANKSILWGSVWFVGGLLVTLISMGSGGRRYIVAYGAILGGLIQLISGLVQRNKY